MRWHFLQTAPASGTYNMALDEALMRLSQRSGGDAAYFRLYGWEAPTLSFGRNQRARGHYDLEVARSLGVRFVRRPTGGRALLHHREITYSVAMPASNPAQAAAAYSFINEVLLDGLRRLGVRATRATSSSHTSPGLRPCFDTPSAHEIVVGDRKLVGSAQWRQGETLLQHGSILVRNDQPMIARLMKAPLGAEPVAATLAETLGWDPSIGDMMQPLREALEQRIQARTDTLDAEAVREDVADTERTYADDAWTWRR